MRISTRRSKEGPGLKQTSLPVVLIWGEGVWKEPPKLMMTLQERQFSFFFFLG